MGLLNLQRNSHLYQSMPYYPKLCYSSFTYLQEEDWKHCSSDGVHQAHVVVDQGLSAASHIDVEFLSLVIIIVVSWVVGEMILDARPWGAGVAAAKWDPIHQVSAINVALDAAKKTIELPRYGGEICMLGVYNYSTGLFLTQTFMLHTWPQHMLCSQLTLSLPWS